MQKKYQEFENKKYESFFNTIQKCCIDFYHTKDDIIGTYIFEDLDIDIRCFLCDEYLSVFLDRGWISNDISEKCQKMRDKFCSLEIKHPELWNVNGVKSSPLWKEIFDLSKEINDLLYW